MTTEQIKAEYNRLTEEIRQAEEQAEPQRRAYMKAMEPVDELRDQLEEFMEKHDAAMAYRCDACENSHLTATSRGRDGCHRSCLSYRIVNNLPQERRDTACSPRR